MTEDASPAVDLPPGTPMGDAELRFTSSGRPFVRTPDSCFADLPEFPYEPHYVEVDGLRMHYIDEGPRDGEVVLLLHGQPDWCYLYRKMIPVLVAGGRRVIAPDLIGMGRSDKPVQIADYRYLQHVAWVEEFVDVLDLHDITVFVQDWGSLIGLRVVGNDPDRFARIVVANGMLPVLPEGFKPLQLPDTLEPDDSLVLPFTEESLQGDWMEQFQNWARYALVGTSFRPSELLEFATVVDLTPAELAAYDAPFPERIYMSGVRAFPSLLNTVGDAPTNEHARRVLDRFTRPALTLFGRLDANMGSDAAQGQIRDRIPGAAGQPHHAYDNAAHFIQEDVGEDLARRVDEFMTATVDVAG